MLSGALIGASLTPDLSFVAVIAYVLLMRSWASRRELSFIMVSASIAGFVSAVVAGHWTLGAIQSYFETRSIAAVLGFIMLCALNNIYLLLAGLAWWGINRIDRDAPAWLLPPLLAVAQHFSPSVFPPTPGLALLFHPLPVVHLAGAMGVFGLGLLVLIVNGVVAEATRAPRMKIRLVRIFFAVTIFATANLMGALLKPKAPSGEKVRILQVQGNIDGGLSRASDADVQKQFEILERYISLTERELGNSGAADLIAWPETAYPLTLNPLFYTHSPTLELRRRIKKWGAGFATGAYSWDEQTDRASNAVFLLGPDAEPVGMPYTKVVPLPFAEYIPGEDYFPWLGQYFPRAAKARPSAKVGHLIRFGNLRIGSTICYESVFPWVTRELAAAGANLLMYYTNDFWFGAYVGPLQHLAFVHGRALETGLPLVRTANTGISAVIDARGDFLVRSGESVEWTRSTEIHVVTNPRATIFTRVGHHLPLALLAVLLAFVSFRNAERFKVLS